MSTNLISLYLHATEEFLGAPRFWMPFSFEILTLFTCLY